MYRRLLTAIACSALILATPSGLSLTRAQAAASEGPTESCSSSYCIVALPGPIPSRALGINNRGDIVGIARERATLWRNGGSYDLGILLPAPGEDYSSSVAYAVNNTGIVVGASGSFGPGANDGLSFSSAFMYDGAMRFVEAPGSTGDGGNTNEGQQAFDINDAGTIVGIEGRQYRGVVWDRGGRHLIAPLSSLDDGNGTVAVAINRDNVVVGATTIGHGPASQLQVHPFVWRVGDRAGITDLGVAPGYIEGIAVAINDVGDIVGYLGHGDADFGVADGKLIGNRDPFISYQFDTLPPAAAVLWQNGHIHQLAGDYSEARAVNNHHVVVGSARGSPVIWDNGRITDLNSLLPPNSQWSLSTATAINDRGWIVGWGDYKLGEQAFLLRPRSSP
jgi:uncharacterized membrane protein